MENKKSTLQINPEVVFAICIFVFYLGWMVVQPFGVAPDESMRYQIPQFIFENGCLPRGDDPSLVNNVWGLSYAFYPILSYMISFVFMKIVSIFTMEATALLFAARMTSVLFGVGTAVVSLKIGKKLFGGKIAWLFATVVSLLPQFVFITSYVNNDSMAIFSTALIVYFWIRGIETKWDIKTCVGLSVALSICALSYYNAYGFILCSAVIYFATYFLSDKDKDSYPVKQFLAKGFLIVGIFVLLVGWWFIRSAIIYNGDFLAMNAMNDCAEIHAIPELKPSLHDTFQNQGRSVFEMLTTTNWIIVTAGSFIGCFGGMEIKLQMWMYGVIGILLVIGLIFWLADSKRVFALKHKDDKQFDKWGIFAWIMLIACIIPNVLNVIYSYGSDYQPQGRYSLPMLIPFGFLVTLGFRKVLCQPTQCEAIYPCVQTKKQETITICVIGLYAFTSVMSYFLVFLPAYIK